jgi:glycyl-tRNA synthetase beta chain
VLRGHAAHPVRAAPPRLVAELAAEIRTEGSEERGPRTGAPDAAVEGFLRKHGATRDMLSEQGGFWVLARPGETVAARDLVARALPGLLRGFPWPKSMRWTGPFTWVRPLRRVLCVLDGEVVPLALEEMPDLAAGAETEGPPPALARRLRRPLRRSLRGGTARASRRARCRGAHAPDLRGAGRAGAEAGVRSVPDRGLLEEVAGLVRMAGAAGRRIDAASWTCRRGHAHHRCA